MTTDFIVITSAKRTPIGHFGGHFKNIPAPQLGATAISAALIDAQLTADQVNAVIMGCVLPAGLGQAPARQAALHANLNNQTDCTTVNKMCGSGMKAIMLAHDIIRTDGANVIIAGGMENMSRAPFLLPGARFGYRLGEQTVQDHLLWDGLTDAFDNHLSMGVIAEQCAQANQLSRITQDQFAIASIERAIYATQAQLFKNEITPVNDITTDEGIQKINIDKIPFLKPAFSKTGTITAANASNISDGAAAVSLMSLSYAKKNHVTPIAKIIAHHTVAGKPADFPILPIAAIDGLLHKIHWKISEVDLFEINEAFAAVTLVTMQKLKIPHEKVNIHGGACVLGHPIGASGARIIVTLLHALQHRKSIRGIAALCIGGGEATAIAIEIIR